MEMGRTIWLYSKLFVFLLGYFIIRMPAASAQEVEVTGYKIQGSQIEISYQASGAVENRVELKLYFSKDGGSTYEMCRSVSGDIGLIYLQESGTIVWEASGELGMFRGKLQFKIEYEDYGSVKPSRVVIPYFGKNLSSEWNIGLALGSKRDKLITALNIGYFWNTLDDITYTYVLTSLPPKVYTGTEYNSIKDPELGVFIGYEVEQRGRSDIYGYLILNAILSSEPGMAYGAGFLVMRDKLSIMVGFSVHSDRSPTFNVGLPLVF